MSESNSQKRTIADYQMIYREELDQVIEFWLRHSLDKDFGGYFNCLDENGKVFDRRKHVWLQGRQVWMFAKLHNDSYAPGEHSEYLEAARIGADFLRKHARDGGRVYFSLTREGKPHFLQRKMFAECFYIMAMAEWARASGDESARGEAEELFQHVLRYAKEPSALGRPSYPHLPATSELAVPMILLNLIEELNGPDGEGYGDISEWCVHQIDKHYRPEIQLILETVGENGDMIDSIEGRVVNPGHAIECGWFLLQYARRTGNAELRVKALDMINWSFDFGWDEKYGGIFYFLDRKGYSPVQLEWSMKLWWPHCEALIAFLAAYRDTGEERYFQLFEKVHDYTFRHFCDPEHGEWYGYLDRRGEVSQRFKGGPYKGCFHVPRALWMCGKILNQLQ